VDGGVVFPGFGVIVLVVVIVAVVALMARR
jgi:hypothetical protein